MSKVLVIGAGGVGSVAVHKMAMNPEIFSDIHLASRTVSKCEAIAESVKQRTGVTVSTYAIDADDVAATTALIKQIGPQLVVNLALPYQDLNIMDACLAAGVNYLDTANYEPRDQAQFEYSWQWAYQDRFKEAGLMALLGSGFDPGVTSVFATWLKKHKLDTIRTLDILDCNGGDHGQHFATNFNPEINIREVTAPARHYENGKWVETPALSTKQQFRFEGVGPKTMYLMYHEELESLAKHLPEIERDPLLDDLRRGLYHAPDRAAERRHDPDRPGDVQGPGNHPAAVPQSRAARTGLARLDHQGQDQHRRHRHRLQGRRGEHLLHLQHLRPRGRLSPRPATRRSATPPASRR